MWTAIPSKVLNHDCIARQKAAITLNYLHEQSLQVYATRIRLCREGCAAEAVPNRVVRGSNFLDPTQPDPQLK